MTTSKDSKLVLAVIDALKPEMLERAIEQGQAPVLAKIKERALRVKDSMEIEDADGHRIAMVKKALIATPVFVAVCWAIWGASGAASAGSSKASRSLPPMSMRNGG